MNQTFFTSPQKHPSLQATLIGVGLMLVGILFLAARTPPPQPPLPPQTLGDFPLAFIPADGAYVTYSQGGTLTFSETGVQLALPDGNPAITFVGAGARVTFSGTDPLPGVANRYQGQDVAQWESGLSTFGAVTYQNLYPGIDLVYDGSEGLLKGTYHVAPHADPAQIRWTYAGVENVELDAATGNLALTLSPESAITEKAPVAYQVIEGVQNPVRVAFQQVGDAFGFAVGTYDPAYALVIDPTLVYSSYLGGNSDDAARDVAVDGAGNVYVTGSTYSTSFPGGGSGNAGYVDMFITKINAAGTAILYTTIVGGNGSDDPTGLAVNANGQVWVIGTTTSDNLPTPQAFQPEAGGGVDAFLLQLNGSGALAFGSYIGGYLYDGGEDVALDSNGDVHIVGSLWGGFFGEVDGQSYELLYLSMLDGQDATAYGVALDPQDNIYITGRVRSTSWPTVNPVQAVCGVYDQWTCSDDAFVLKLNPAGDELLFNTYLGGSASNGGSGTDIGHAIAVDANGVIAVTGETFASDFPVANAVQTQKSGANHMSDAFVARLTPQGDGYQLSFSTYLGGSETDYGSAVVFSGTSVFIAGLTNSTNFPVQAAFQPELGPGVCFSSTSRNCHDAFVAQFAANGSLLLSTYWGGTDDDHAEGLALDGSGNLYVVGSAESMGFPTSGGGFQPNRGTGGEGFVMKIGTGSTPPTPTPTVTPPPLDLPEKIYLPVVVR